jgi:hypothetical protein
VIDSSILDTLPGFVDEDTSAGSDHGPDSTVNFSCFKLVGKKELEQIQCDISDTTRPRWQSGPPVQIGTKGCGKLKADQFREAIDFDIPMSLMKMWSMLIEGNHLNGRRKKAGISGQPQRPVSQHGLVYHSPQRALYRGDAVKVRSRPRLVDVSF